MGCVFLKATLIDLIIDLIIDNGSIYDHSLLSPDHKQAISEQDDHAKTLQAILQKPAMRIVEKVNIVIAKKCVTLAVKAQEILQFEFHIDACRFNDHLVEKVSVPFKLVRVEERSLHWYLLTNH